MGVWAHEHENPPRTRNQTKRNGSGTKAENSDVVVGMALLIGRYDLQSRENVCIPILTSYICRYLHSFLPMSSPHKCFPYITVHFPGLLTHSLALHETNPPSHVYLAHEIPFGGKQEDGRDKGKSIWRGTTNRLVRRQRLRSHRGDNTTLLRVFQNPCLARQASAERDGLERRRLKLREWRS